MVRSRMQPVANVSQRAGVPKSQGRANAEKNNLSKGCHKVSPSAVSAPTLACSASLDPLDNNFAGPGSGSSTTASDDDEAQAARTFLLRHSRAHGVERSDSEHSLPEIPAVPTTAPPCAPPCYPAPQVIGIAPPPAPLLPPCVPDAQVVPEPPSAPPSSPPCLPFKFAHSEMVPPFAPPYLPLWAETPRELTPPPCAPQVAEMLPPPGLPLWPRQDLTSLAPLAPSGPPGALPPVQSMAKDCLLSTSPPSSCDGPASDDMTVLLADMRRLLQPAPANLPMDYGSAMRGAAVAALLSSSFT
eukprot:CAMPEP_0194510698 /NCGR_PEP_ID=MMETSP0253-20130528/42116_1 /TAXON_ID=2966 /ORGANISM="Noctiluca scintillans" /LENGTH=299 /DNA_ID=CAMNT_0039353961 /DNA_START=53 /DNA_END=952 /DNA_ORIENTATION=-